MDIQAKRDLLIEWVSNLQDTRLIEALFKIAKDADWWNQIPETERKKILEGLADVEAGRLTEHAVVKELYAKFL